MNRATAPDLILCRVGELTIGIDIGFVQEVNRLVQCTPVPRMSPEILGLVNLRGSLITVFDLNLVLHGRPLKRSTKTRNVVVDHDCERFGILVDAVGDVLPVDGQLLEPLPSHTGADLAGYLDGLVEREGEAVLVLNLGAVLRCEVAAD